MNNKKIILEIIDDLLDIRKRKYEEYTNALIETEWAIDAMNNPPPDIYGVYKENASTRHDIFNFENEEDYERDIWEEFVSEFDVPLIKLNNLLSVEDRKAEVLEIEKNIALIQSKRFITVKEFEIKYNVSSDKQARLRGKGMPSLNRDKEGGKISYDVIEIEKWIKNNGI